MKKFKTAKELLSDKSRWCKGSLYKLQDGTETDKRHAEKVCLLGALHIVYGSGDKYSKARSKLLTCIGGFFNIPTFNDHRSTTHKKLMSVLEKANI